MQARLSRIDWAVDGFDRTGIPLVGWIDPRFFPAEDSDDFGLYYICLRLVKNFDLQPADALLAVQLTFLSVALALSITAIVFLLRDSQPHSNP